MATFTTYYNNCINITLYTYAIRDKNDEGFYFSVRKEMNSDMTEGGGKFTSINSAENSEYTCLPCGEDGIRDQAIKYCPVCQEHLCTKCTRHHGRHELLDSDACTKAPIKSGVTKCNHHQDFDIEMYCEEHDMVYCRECIATEHRFVAIPYMFWSLYYYVFIEGLYQLFVVSYNSSNDESL